MLDAVSINLRIYTDLSIWTDFLMNLYRMPAHIRCQMLDFRCQILDVRRGFDKFLRLHRLVVLDWFFDEFIQDAGPDQILDVRFQMVDAVSINFSFLHKVHRSPNAYPLICVVRPFRKQNSLLILKISRTKFTHNSNRIKKSPDVLNTSKIHRGINIKYRGFVGERVWGTGWNINPSFRFIRKQKIRC